MGYKGDCINPILNLQCSKGNQTGTLYSTNSEIKGYETPSQGFPLMPWRFKWGRDDFVLWDLRPHCGKAERLGHADGEGTCRQGMAWTKVQWPEKCGQAEWTPWWVMWKGGMLLKRRVELCLQAIKCSKEAAWLLANAEGGIEDYRMERKRP